jgi:hypothetical protein
VVKDWLASISPEAVEPIVTLSPDYPDNRIGVSVEAAAPGRAESRSVACADL